MDLTNLGVELRRGFDEKTAAREAGLAGSRNVIRSCGNGIRALHRGEVDSARSLIDAAQRELHQARRVLEGHEDILMAGFVHDAEKELAEARITLALVSGAPMPTPREMDVPPSAFLKGMAESIGELRRHILDLMRRGDLSRCETLLDEMDDIYYLLISMDYPDGITHGLRRLTDVARSIIERTRGDFTTSSIQSSLRDALQQHAVLLGEH
ncbi:MAG: haloacid dehalogenase [Actinomycetota bacterium]|nr:haloacid dehalogenase [Actinomycetota bacterium]